MFFVTLDTDINDTGRTSRDSEQEYVQDGQRQSGTDVGARHALGGTAGAAQPGGNDQHRQTQRENTVAAIYCTVMADR